MSELIHKPTETISKIIEENGNFPNNSKLPLILYRQAAVLNEGDAATIEKIFQQNQWGNSWRNGIYNYHHYHSTAHEVLGIYAGNAKVQLGGPNGLKFDIKAGDIIIIPAGVAHKNLGSSSDFACVGAYPPGQHFDMNYGKDGERPKVDENIKAVGLPNTDPVYGSDGKLMQEWH